MLFSLFSGAGMTNIACSFLTSAILPACYTPAGPIPEARQPREELLWTNEQVDAVVNVDYVTILGGEPVFNTGSPPECDKVSFLRFRHADGPEDAEEADAAFLMVPGVLEGANGFEFMGRQMVYKAAEHDERHIEVWAMDRRSNCLEDLTGTHAAAAADSAEEAANLLVGYYYEGLEIDGQQFEGFLTSPEMPFLYEFGIRQTTLDMQAIIDHMMPTQGVRQEKLFVGGHSLGGMHTSVYLGWNFDEDPNSEAGAGYNQVAGAFALDSHIARLDSALFMDMAEDTQASAMPDDTLDRLSEADDVSDYGHQLNLWLLRWGLIPRNITVPGLFNPEIIALPEHLGIMAAKAPDEEGDLYDRVDSPILDNIVNVIHSRSPATIGAKPRMEHFRYTNEALVGLMFDHNFQMLGFLKTGLGFKDGGTMQRKWTTLNALAGLDNGGGALQRLVGNSPHYIARDAGPDRDSYGQGPLYRWVHRDELGTAKDPEFRDTTGEHVFTSMDKEPVAMEDFVRALHTGPTNLTEWYFPTRILLDLTVVDQPFAPDHGLMTYHLEGPSKVPSMVLNGGDGIGFSAPDEESMPLQVQVVAPGYTHMDPMFEAVNSPTQESYVMRPLLEFAYTVLDSH